MPTNPLTPLAQMSPEREAHVDRNGYVDLTLMLLGGREGYIRIHPKDAQKLFALAREAR